MNVDGGVGTGVSRADVMVEANAEFVRFLESCTTEDWGRICSSEGWTVAAVAYHIARGHQVVAGWIETLRDGRAVPGSPREHDANNAAMAAEAAGVTRERVITLAQDNGSRLAAVLNSLNESELAMGSSFGPAGGERMTVEQLAGNRGHLDAHLASIRETLAR
jgi:hypothetical protein